MVSVVSNSISSLATGLFATSRGRTADVKAAKALDVAGSERDKALDAVTIQRLKADPEAAATAVTEAAAYEREALELYDRGIAVMSIVRSQQKGVLKLFGLDAALSPLPGFKTSSAPVQSTAEAGGAASGPSATVSTAVAGSRNTRAVDVTGTDTTQAGDPTRFEWLVGDAAPDFSGDFLLGGAMTFTASAQFEDLASGQYQRVFDFGNGSFQNNILMGQFANSSTMLFEIYDQGNFYRVSAENAIVEGERAIWTARVGDDASICIFKNGALLGSAQGPADGVETIARASNFVGESNWSQDDALDGTVYGLGIEKRALSDEQVAQSVANGDPWA